MKPTYEAAFITRRARAMLIHRFDRNTRFDDRFFAARRWAYRAISRLRRLGKWEEAEELREAWFPIQ